MAKREKDGGLWANLKAAFGGRADEAPAPTAAAPAMKGEEDHLVNLSLEQMLAAEPDLPVYVISLKEYRQALGAHWPKIETKVLLLAESVVRRVTKVGGMVTQKGDCFMIAYKPLYRSQGAKHSSDAAIELGQRLVGANFSIAGEGNAPSIAMATVRASELLGEDGVIHPAKLIAVAEAARALGDEPATAATGSAKAGKPVNWQAFQTEGQAAEGTLVAMEKAKAKEAADWQKFQAAKGRTTEITMVPLDPPKKKRADPVWLPIGKDK